MPSNLKESPHDDQSAGNAMAKKQSGDAVRLPPDIARKARVIAATLDMSLPEYVAAKLRPIVEEELPQAIRMLGMAGDDEKPSKK